MGFTTEKRVKWLEAADGQHGVVHVVMDTLPDDEGDAGRTMTEEHWKAVPCRAEGRQ